MQNNLLQKFVEYVNEWNKLDSFRLNWLLKYPLYLPIGFWLEMRNLSKKCKLTSDYSKYLESMNTEEPKYNVSDEEGVDMGGAVKLQYIGLAVAIVLVTLASWGISVLYWFTYNL